METKQGDENHPDSINIINMHTTKLMYSEAAVTILLALC